MRTRDMMTRVRMTYRQEWVCAVVQHAREELQHALDEAHRLTKRVRDPDNVTSVLRKRGAKLGRYLHEVKNVNRMSEIRSVEVKNVNCMSEIRSMDDTSSYE